MSLATDLRHLTLQRSFLDLLLMNQLLEVCCVLLQLCNHLLLVLILGLRFEVELFQFSLGLFDVLQDEEILIFQVLDEMEKLFFCDAYTLI